MALFRTGCVEHKCSLQLLDQSARGAEVGQSCQTMCMCVKISILFQYLKFMLCCVLNPYSYFFSPCIALLMSFSICLLTLTSYLLLLLKVLLIPRFSVELLRRTEAAALSFASALRETEEEREIDRREGDMVGRLIHV